MKLWELEANCLKLCFADSDMQFGEADFGIGSDSQGDAPVRANSNTNQYLVRITDSIRRAIDLYREICGRDIAIFESGLFKAFYDSTNAEVATEEESIVSKRVNRILIPSNKSIEKIKRIKVYNLNSNQLFDDNVDFRIVKNTDLSTKRTFIVLDQDYAYYENVYNKTLWKFEIEFDLEYPYVTTSTPFTADLADFDIPEPVQDMIPVYVKGEIYEEDEAQLALNAKNEYMAFLQRYSKNRNTVQKRVKPAKVFTKR